MVSQANIKGQFGFAAHGYETEMFLAEAASIDGVKPRRSQLRLLALLALGLAVLASPYAFTSDPHEPITLTALLSTPPV